MPVAKQSREHRAAPPELPPRSPAQERDWLSFKRYRTDRETIERHSVVRGLLVMAVVVLIASIVRAGLDRVFVPGWWRP
jgi:hypothetical protein